jgi:hypothetical protein
VDVLGEGMVKVVWVALMVGGFGSEANAGAESASTATAALAHPASLSAARPFLCCPVVVVIRPTVARIALQVGDISLAP